MPTPTTIPQCWLDQVQRQRGGRPPALRQKEFGIWSRWSWNDEYEQVRDLALGLLTLPVQRGERVVIVGDNDRQYLWAVLALLAVGASVVGAPSDAAPAELQYVISHADARLVFGSDQEQCDKLLALKETLPQLNQIVYWKDRGMWLYHDPTLLDFAALQAQGRQSQTHDAAQFEALIAAGSGDDVALLGYTSGVAGPPKGVLLSHTNILATARAFSANDPRSARDNYLSFVPLTTANGMMFELAAHVLDGVVLNFAEKPETVPQNLREIAPDGLLYPARVWENLASSIQLAMLDASWFNRRLYQACVDGGGATGWVHTVGKPSVLRPLLSQLGLHRARSVYTTGSPLDPAVIRFFHTLGLPLRQLYSATEMAGGFVAHAAGAVQPTSLGKPLSDTTIKIEGQDEIWVSGPGLCMGYHKADAATEAAIHTDGQGVRWFRTGDLGRMVEGELIYKARQTDLITLADGTLIAPHVVEGPLKWSPYISHALVFADQTRSSIVALIVVDAARVGRWAVEQGLNYAGFSALSQLPDVYTLLADEICTINQTLSAPAWVRRFVLLPRPWSADAGEMTRTGKLRRQIIKARNAAILAALDDDQAATPGLTSDGLQIGHCEIA